jgi:hypothetical protein
VRFHREPKIGGLHPKGFAHSLDLQSHPTLVLERAEVLNHGIAEHDVEALVVELSEVGGIRNDALDVLVQLFMGK